MKVKKEDDNKGFCEVSVNHPLVQKKINKTLDLSVQEGGYHTAHFNLSSIYLSPFALAMNATSAQVGILSGIENLAAGITQLFSCKLIEKNSRKKIIVSSMFIQALLWIPIILTSLLFFNHVSYTVWILIGLVGLFYISRGMIMPAWYSLMGSIVPEKTRGRFFAKRNRHGQFIGVLTMVGAAIFLDFAKRIGSERGEVIGYTLLGFSIIFVIAMIIRFYCSYLISKHYEPKLKIKRRDHYTLFDFLKNAKSDAFARFAIFNAIFRFSVGIASPFFVVYLLKDLGYSYTWYMIIIVSQILFQVFFLKIIGKMSDKFGNIILIKISTILIALTPLTFLLSYFIPFETLTVLYLIFFAQLLNGIGWAGFNLSSATYVFDSMKQERQGYGLAYSSLFNGISFFLGALIGSIISEYHSGVTGVILIIFLISFIARMSTALFVSKILKEVKSVKRFNTNFLIHEIHPIKGTINGIHHLNPFHRKVIHHI